MKKLFFLAFVFAVMQSSAQFTKIYDFTGVTSDGFGPRQPPVKVGDYLYGTANSGGASYGGVIYKVRTDGSDYSVIHNFGNGTGTLYGGGSKLITDNTYIYGITAGTSDAGSAVIYKIKPDGTGYTILRSLSSADGKGSLGSFLLKDDYLYATASSDGVFGWGTLFKIKTDGTDFQKLHDFDKTGINTDGGQPFYIVINGDYIYGTATGNWLIENPNKGIIYRIKTDGTDYSVIRNFTSTDSIGTTNVSDIVTDGSYLYSNITETSLGIYTFGGFFRINFDGSDLQVLYAPAYDNTGGERIWSLLIDGNDIYGTYLALGAYNRGVLYKLKTDGTGYTVLNSFNQTGGESPQGGLTISDGVLYGTTYQGGVNGGVFGAGTVFKYGSEALAVNSNTKKEIALYPNPVKDLLYFSEEISNIKITDVSGRLIKQILVASKSADVSQLAKGVYVVSAVTKEGKLITRKIIKE